MPASAHKTLQEDQRDPIEIAALGGSVVAHSRVSGAILLEDPAKAAQLSDPDARAALAREFDIWSNAGMFAASRKAYPDPVSYIPGPRSEVLTCVSPRAMARVICHDQAMRRSLRATLAPILSKASPRARDHSVEVIPANPGFGVFYDTESVWGRADFDLARHLALREILIALNGQERTAAVLHASAVKRNEKALLLAGESGHGKSTLALSLASQGADLISDDLVPLNRDGKTIGAFPTATSLKEASWALPELASFRLSTQAVTQVQGAKIKYLPPPSLSWEDTAVGALVFPEYCAQGTPEIERWSPETAFVKLIESGTRLTPPLNTVFPLAGLINRIPAFVLRYANTHQALSMVDEITREW